MLVAARELVSSAVSRSIAAAGARAAPLALALIVGACGGGDGTPGPAGPEGPEGPAGPPGERGPAGEQGPIGPTGPTGPTGQAGPQGVAGAQGAMGATGPAGPIGPAGPQGMAGAMGLQGPAGAQGMQGPQGPAGPAGTFSGTFNGDVTFSGNLTLIGSMVRPIGTDKANPAASCQALLTARPGLGSGVYWLKPITAATAFEAYCDMITDGGGWTLVWSNLRGGRHKPVTELQWKAATTMLPRTDGRPVNDDLESFIVFTGLAHWQPLAPAGLLRYDWAPDYDANIEQRYRVPFTFGANFTLNLTAGQGQQQVGNVVPGLITLHNGRPFSAYDRDLDTDTINCGAAYTATPFWYAGCWSGSINGGGELSTSGHYNGAYWTGSATQWGSAGGVGAGNGWMYVR